MMNSLYSKYCKEVMNLDIIEDDNSFVTYLYIKAGNIACIKVVDMYVSENNRGNSKWLELMNKIELIAKERECSIISAQISKYSPEHVQKRTMHLCEKYNMKKAYEDLSLYIYSRSV